MKKLSLKEKRIMDIFISSTKKIIDEDGIDKVTIRNIAQNTGYNSATIYSYFKSLDILKIYVSIGYLKEYTIELSKELKGISNPIEMFLKVYEIFNKHAFKNPDLYFNMFYGSYSYHLPEIIQNYYDIYPNELSNDYDENIKTMLREGNIFKRDKNLTKRFLKENIISEENLELLIDVIVRTHMSYLYDVKEGNVIDIKKHSEKFLRNISKLINVLKY